MNTVSQASPRYPHPLLPVEIQERYRSLGFWEDITLADIVQRGAHHHPDRVAITGETQLSYAQLWEQSCRLAGTLGEAGLRPVSSCSR